MVKQPSETRKRQTDRRRKTGHTWTTVSRSCQSLGIEQAETQESKHQTVHTPEKHLGVKATQPEFEVFNL